MIYADDATEDIDAFVKLASRIQRRWLRRNPRVQLGLDQAIRMALEVSHARSEVRHG